MFKQITDQTGTGVFVLKVSSIVVKKIKANCWQFIVDPFLSAVLQHSRVSCCIPELSMGTHPSKTSVQPPSLEQHNSSAVTVKDSQQGKMQKKLKEKDHI